MTAPLIQPGTAQATERDLYVRLFEEIDKKLDKVDGRFDKVDDRFDKLDDKIDAVDTRLTRIEATNLGTRIEAVEKAQQELTHKLTRIETIMLPITGLGSAVAGAIVTWASGLLPHH